MTAQVSHPADYDPSLIEHRLYATRRKLGRLDATVIICLMIALLMIVPTRLIVPGTTDEGRPALLVCMVMCFWWIVVRLSPGLTLVGPQPVRWAVVIYLFSNVASYALGYLRGLTTMEANAADRWMIATAAFIGLILLTADGIANWERLRLVMRVLVGCAVFMSVVGLIQFITRYDLVQYMYGLFPGLEIKGRVMGMDPRGDAVRVTSTTQHYIELSAVLATVLPFALHLARFGHSAKARRWYGISALLIAAGVLTTISRTGIAAVVIVAFILIPLWPPRMRYNIIVLTIGLFAGLAVAKPQLATTFLDIFAGASNDPSITSRTSRYEMVAYYFAQHPWFGRGSGTWVWPAHQFLDNNWLGTALERGLFGVAALAGLHLTGIVLAILAWRRSVTKEDRHLCAVLFSTQLIAIFAGATFDLFSFTTYSTTMALTIGLCGTVWRFTHPARQVRTSMVLSRS